uniref:Putative nuclear movement domain protein n=1 Tax=Toxoplasma gondii COUG TaxID=1074873 RepID=A0A2G8XNA3_TOXGO|nr:putative nuclear movement domain protein [Toxoplasma gondii COUG]
MVDYSKWERLQVSSSDEEEVGGKPRVRRFEEKQRVTVGPEGVFIEGKEDSKVEELGDAEDAWTEEMDAGDGDTAAEEAFEDAHEWPRCGFLPSASFASPSGEEPQRKGLGSRAPPSASSSASAVSSPQQKREDEALLIRNGGVVEGRYWWSQTQHEVTVDVRLPEGVRAKEVKVDIHEDGLTCQCRGAPVLQGAFPHKVEADEELWFWELLEKKVNWRRLAQLAKDVNGQSEERTPATDGTGAGADACPTPESRAADQTEKEAQNLTETEGEAAGEGQEEVAVFLEINLRKKPEVAGTYVWWNCVVKGGPSVNVEKLPGRAAKAATTKNFKTAWEKAHQMFLEKLKSEPREPMEV